jgi:hypothetical protein
LLPAGEHPGQPVQTVASTPISDQHQGGALQLTILPYIHTDSIMESILLLSWHVHPDVVSIICKLLLQLLSSSRTWLSLYLTKSIVIISVFVCGSWQLVITIL